MPYKTLTAEMLKTKIRNILGVALWNRSDSLYIEIKGLISKGLEEKGLRKSDSQDFNLKEDNSVADKSKIAALFFLKFPEVKSEDANKVEYLKAYKGIKQCCDDIQKPLLGKKSVDKLVKSFGDCFPTRLLNWMRENELLTVIDLPVLDSRRKNKAFIIKDLSKNLSLIAFVIDKVKDENFENEILGRLISIKKSEKSINVRKVYKTVNALHLEPFYPEISSKFKKVIDQIKTLEKSKDLSSLDLIQSSMIELMQKNGMEYVTDDSGLNLEISKMVLILEMQRLILTNNAALVTYDDELKTTLGEQIELLKLTKEQLEKEVGKFLPKKPQSNIKYLSAKERLESFNVKLIKLKMPELSQIMLEQPLVLEGKSKESKASVSSDVQEQSISSEQAKQNQFNDNLFSIWSKKAAPNNKGENQVSEGDVELQIMQRGPD